jgi:tetratricopeptide (TPR) repeat protein
MTLALPAAAQPQQQMEWCVNKGNAFSPNLQFKGCTGLISRGIFKGRDLALVFWDRGNAYYAKKDYDRAIADYGEAIRLDNIAKAFDNRGRAYDDKKDYDRAIADCSEAIRLDPNFAMAFNNRGNAYNDKNDYDRAIADYNFAYCEGFRMPAA